MTTPPGTGLEVPDVLVVRQPILDGALDPCGYELVSPPGPGRAGEPAAVAIARSVASLGLPSVTGGKPAFVDVDRAVLCAGDISALASEDVVLELGRDVVGETAVVDALRAREGEGFDLVLDGFTPDDPRAELLTMVHGAKLDFRDTDPSGREAIAARVREHGIDLLATGVDTRAQADEAFALGCNYVQGYFFVEPSGDTDRRGVGPPLVRLLEEAGRDGLDYGSLAEAIEADADLRQRFLYQINATYFGWRQPITSLRQVFVLLGEERTREWAALVVMAILADDRPREVAVTAYQRARFCELLGPDVAGVDARGFDLFSLGLFSLVGAVLGQPLADAVTQLPLATPVAEALRGAGSPLAELLDVVVAYERGMWADVSAAMERLGVGQDVLVRRYLDAVQWVSDLFQLAGVGES